MNNLLKQSTAFTFRLGPFVDTADGFTPKTGLSLVQADFRLAKAGGAFAQKNDATGGTHDENGYYTCVLNATDTATLGRLRIHVNKAGALPVWETFTVVAANVFDSLVNSSAQLKVETATITANAVTATAIQTGAITAAKFGAGAIDAAAIATDAITAAKIAANAIGASELATDAVEEIADQVWDEVLTGATHNVPSSAGRRLRTLTGNIITEGTAQAGAAGSITLEAGTSFADDTLQLNYITIVGGLGAGQTRVIVDWSNTSKVAVINRNWITTPDNTSEYIVSSNANIELIDIGTAQAATATSLTLRSGAPPDNDSLIGATLVILAGTGREQTRIITDYNGTTKVADIVVPWAVTPDTTSAYAVFQGGRAIVTSIDTGAIVGSSFGVGAIDAAALNTDAVNEIVDQVWDELANQHVSVGSMGKLLNDVPTAAANATELLDQANGVEASRTVRGALRLILAAAAGKLSGAPTGPVLIRDTGDTKDRINATVDANGNRSAVTLDDT